MKAQAVKDLLGRETVRNESLTPSSCRRHRTHHNRTPPHKPIVFIVLVVLLCFAFYCFTSTVSSTLYFIFLIFIFFYFATQTRNRIMIQISDTNQYKIIMNIQNYSII